MRHSLLLFALLASPVFADAPLFTDIAPASGLDFTHWNGMTGELYFIEMTGQGGAFLDYDGDGDLDVFLVQGAPIPGAPLTAPAPVLTDRLFRNDLGGDGAPRFVDVTEKSALAATGYGMGVATGDVDNDGFPDLYVTNFGPNQLWRNRGDGTFEDASAAFGPAAQEARWSTSAAFFDFDADGWLDLYVVDYVDYRLEDNVECFATSSRRDYCGPAAFPPLPDRLWRNRGPDENGRVSFEDVTLERLRGYAPGPGLGVVTADLDGDGRIDFYVANDGEVNQLWLQRREPAPDGGERAIFRDEALLAGVAVNRAGRPEASMGLDAGDVDNDGDEDLVLAHLMEESNTLYVNEGGGLFTDRSVESGLASPSLAVTAFGAGWLDVDNDGFLDLLMVNGAVKIIEEQAQRGDPFPLAQANQLFLNRGQAGRPLFEEATAHAGAAFAVEEVSRGAAFGDVDNDGDADVLVTNNNGPARLLRNDAARGHGWLGLRLAGPGGGLGAVATIQLDGSSSLRRRARTDGSYCSAHDPRVLFGLGGRKAPVDVEVAWPSGARRVARGLPSGVFVRLSAPNEKRSQR